MHTSFPWERLVQQKFDNVLNDARSIPITLILPNFTVNLFLFLCIFDL